MSLMSSIACREVIANAGADAMLRNVCEWRLAPSLGAQFAELLEVAGVGRPAFLTETRTRDRMTTKQCVMMELRRAGASGCSPQELGRRCQCASEAAVLTIHRLRKELLALGHHSEIEWRRGRGQSGGHYVFVPTGHMGKVADTPRR